MLPLIAILWYAELILANYLIIKDFSNGQRVLNIDIVKISHDHCLGPIFNLHSQTLCEKDRKLRLTTMSKTHKDAYDILSINQTKSEKIKSCLMVATRYSNCSIKYQMTNAKKLKFGAIIYISINMSFAQEIVEFAEKEPLLTVSVIMINVKDGMKLLNMISNRFCYAQLMSYDLPPAILMIYIFLMGVVIFITYSIYKLGRYLNILWMRIKQSINMKIYMSNLKIQKYKAGDEDSCAICLMEFSTNSKVRNLPCGHGFHPRCIDHWIRSHKPTCPLCNQQLPIPEGILHVKCAICSSPVTGGYNSGSNIHGDRHSQNTILTADDFINTNEDQVDNRLIDNISSEMDSNTPQQHVTISPNHNEENGNDKLPLYELISRRDGITEQTTSITLANLTINDETV